MRIPAAIAIVLLLANCQTTGPGEGGLFPQRYTPPDARYDVTANSDIEIIYIGARDCPPCWRFKGNDYPNWVASKEYGRVTYRELEFPSYKSTDNEEIWPDDLKWLLDATETRRGAPRWIVLVDGRIVSNQKGWKFGTYPLIQRLVSRKAGT